MAVPRLAWVFGPALLVAFACGATPDDRALGKANTPPDRDGGTTPSTSDDGGDPGEPPDDRDVEVTKDAGGVGFPGNYSSPSIVRDGASYHVYFAQQKIAGTRYNVPHATFTTDGTFTVVGDAIPKLGAKAVDGGLVWAPGAAKIAADRWMLYYTAQLEGTVSKKCIWRAHAATANGPFVDDYDGPIVCPTATQWAIDPYLVADEKNVWHLAARVDLPGGINTIQIRALNAKADDFAAASSWSTLTENAPTSWEQPVLENAGVVRLTPTGGGAPHWFVFYSARAWSDDTYAIGYADCGAKITGPCTKKTPTAPWIATDAASGVFGPGTPTFYSDQSGSMLMSAQAWELTGGKSNKSNTGQIMRTYTLALDAAYAPTATILRIDK